MKTSICLFVYNRPSHTSKVLEGLKKNNIKNLYIFSDGCKNAEDVGKVTCVRKIIRDIKWCKTGIIENKKNKGLADSIVNGVNHILKKHERIIVLEDDCVPSADFISFMEKCFDKYENNERVMNITGFSLPIDIPDNYSFDIYFSYRSSSWGWGTWRRAWKYFDRDKQILEEINKSSHLGRKINRAGEDLIPMLKEQNKGKLDSWAVFWSINIIKNNGICVNPVKSKIKNIGHDNTGTHCGSNKRYEVNIYEEDIDALKLPDEIIIDEEIIKRYQEFFHVNLKKKSKRIISKILNSIGLPRFTKASNKN